MYIRNKVRLCNQLGIQVDVKIFDVTVKEEILINEIETLNDEKLIHGIFLQLPLPSHLDANKIISTIDPKKDLDGIHPQNLGRLINHTPGGLVPCTARAIMELFNFMGVSISGKNVTIVGRSNIVGKPLALLMTNANATVNICHSYTKDLIDKTKSADIVVCAIGKGNFFNREYFNQEQIVIDVGINKTEDRIVGDVEYSSVSNYVKYLTPVPGGIGPLTVVYLIQNIIDAYNLQN